jgi:hypothetical protein
VIRVAEVVQVRIADLVEDWTILPRGENSLSAAHVARLADALEAGEVLPPITIDEASRRIVDGIHRVRAHKRLKREMIPAVCKVYASEMEMFADAVRLNRAHGLPLDRYDVRRAVIRLMEYGLKPKEISDITRVSLQRIDEIRAECAISRDNEPVVLKAGLEHLTGRTVTRQQERAIEQYGGMSATFYARQILLMLQSKLLKPTPTLISTMDELVEAWHAYKKTHLAGV